MVVHSAESQGTPGRVSADLKVHGDADIAPHLSDRLAGLRVNPGVVRDRSWAKVGLLGIVWMCGVGAIANSAEIIAVWRIETLEAQPQLLTGLWSSSIVLFTSAMVPWATAILSFSIAGRISGVIPVWLAGLGLIMAISGLMTGIGIVSAVTGGWAEIPSFVAFILVNIWVFVVSVLMLRK